MLRVTTNATNETMLNYIWNNQAKYAETSEQLGSGKKLNRPSDNAADSISLLNVNKKINQFNSYLNNMELGNNEIDTLDNTMNTTTKALQKAHDLCVTASNGTNPSSAIKAIKTEIDQIIKGVMDTANTNYNGVYIFAGTNTGTAPYTQTTDGSVVYSGTPETGEYQRYIQIADGIKVAVNISGDQVFGSYDATTNTGTGAFGALCKFSHDLSINPPDYDAIRQNLDTIKGSLDNVSNVRTNFAAISSRFDMTTSSTQTSLLQLKSYRSQLEDVDFASAATDLANEQYALQATMAVASSNLQKTSLLNYL